MRISGGVLKGRRILCPPGSIRPAMDKMRESVFSILGDLSGTSFLDLFSGSGIIALEAASRGAGVIDAVEADTKKRAALLANIALAPVRIRCRFMPAELYIKRAKDRCFNYIFCDPPFPYRFKKELIEKLAASPLVNGQTLIALHHPRQEDMNMTGIFLVDHREYGRSVVDFFRPDALDAPHQ